MYDVLQDAQSVTTFNLDLDVDIATVNKKQHRSSNPFYKMTFIRDIFVGSKVLSIINHVISTSTIDVPVCCVQKSVDRLPRMLRVLQGEVDGMSLHHDSSEMQDACVDLLQRVTLPSPMSKATASPIHNSLLSIVNLLLRPNRCSRLY